ncbi:MULTISPECIES: glycine betaine ABC transporter substrate-binding protein [Caballeronia]|jgi:osmoprotectant transport system substrate-binding protein|uniref:Glycine betaine ABC transporter substrate-binding protein n=3 Tax=Caballeronia TaxID=1827195 RepID=A0ACB5QQQ4_9BURK|nr:MULTISPECIES: glycine betaine ABC transporter substrate-binding protein [Caballeronia]KAK44876.1 glycine/betaine ABC transporter substrate-binding protein [Caballeronia jiangsuensis]MBC8636391.1 glycine betaine ABC transporter substrate-binding protein [Caballeronia sp. EK]MDR5746088.1 glycine betaine ABC transporter substrate-binding protein [Caballeronia sp. LZ029]GJH09717.1 glycine betaine ABC transporter substrate-binding protein [Caballeronia novacaledonica]GJH16965.1 glycine betaine A
MKKLFSVSFGILISMFASFTASAASVVVGGKNFTEQQLMAEMTSRYLEAKGFTVTKKDGMGSAVLRQAQENGQVDVYWEYTGTSLITYNKVNDRLSPDDTYKKVKELDAAKGLVWLNPSKANNTYAFAMNQDEAKKLGIVTMSDLAKAIKGGKELTFACNSEFYARPDGLRPLQKQYGFEFSQGDVKRMDTGLTYQALKDHQVDVALVFATDGRVPAFNFVLLKDDKGYFPSYALTPVVRKATLDANPTLGPLLNALSAKLDAPTMARLNASVDVQKKSFSDVANQFLKESGLI